MNLLAKLNAQTILKTTCDSLISMKKSLLLLSLFMSCISFAQSNLPPCNGNFTGPCFGVYEYSNGAKYVGQFKDGLRNGQGTLTHASGDKYVGQYKDDKRNGQGTYTFADGRTYVGQFKDANYDGFGTFYNPNGSIKQQGLWRDGVFVQSQAQEQINFPACNGDFSGPCFGFRDYPNGDKYVGQFLNGNCSGQGTHTFFDGRIYVGQWRDDKRNGQGTLTWPNGDKYVGQFNEGLRNGQGTLTLTDGRQYVGQWKDAKFNGQGTYTWPDGFKYVGQFIDDFRNGQGTLTFPDGRQYTGQYKNDKRNGYGTYYNANGSINQQGIWKDGEFVQSETPQIPPPKIAPVVPKPPVPISNPQDIKRQKCIRLGLAPGSADFQQCMN